MPCISFAFICKKYFDMHVVYTCFIFHFIILDKDEDFLPPKNKKQRHEESTTDENASGLWFCFDASPKKKRRKF